MTRIRKSLTAFSVAVLLATLATTLAVASGPAGAAPVDGFRLIRPEGQITTTAYESQVAVPVPVYVAAYGRGLEVEVGRPDYATRVSANLSILDNEGEVLETTQVPRRLVRSFDGFRNAVFVVVRDEAGDVVQRQSLPWCPNAYSKQRVDPNGPSVPRYPMGCTSHPFSTGMVWGIEPGWAAPVVEYLYFPGTIGTYTVTVRISKGLGQLLGVPADDRSTTIDVIVEDDMTFGPVEEPPFGESPIPVGLSPEPRHSVTPRPRPVLGEGTPDPATLPDLAALPAYGMSVDHNSRGLDRLNFFAHEWNAGPAPLVVEGFRRSRGRVMDSYQVLYDGDEPAEWRQVGTMEFHEAPQHNHWHFLDFAKYDLIDADGEQVGRSGKQSWCLVPTDAIDLTIEGAEWLPGQTGLSTACGGPEALWIRETLPVGWGDTYSQYQTQAINITDVPNGTYWLRIEVNPTGALFETTADNNISLRRVVLGGTRGDRTVRVPPYRLVDTDGAGQGPGGGDDPEPVR